jgi:hypothetical protein
MRDPGSRAADRENGLNAGVEQTPAKNALPDHARCAEEDDFHDTIRPLTVYPRGPILKRDAPLGILNLD